MLLRFKKISGAAGNHKSLRKTFTMFFFLLGKNPAFIHFCQLQMALLHLNNTCCINEVEMKKHCPTERDDNGETEQSWDVG